MAWLTINDWVVESNESEFFQYFSAEWKNLYSNGTETPPANNPAEVPVKTLTHTKRTATISVLRKSMSALTYTAAVTVRNGLTQSANLTATINRQNDAGAYRVDVVEKDFSTWTEVS